MKTQGTCARALWLGLLLGVASAQAVPYVVLPAGRKEGTEIRANSKGDVILTSADGQRTFTKGQYLEAWADKPADYDKALQLGAAKNYDEAIKMLQGVATQFRFLGWDNKARLAIAQIQVAKADPVAAVATFDEILRESPQLKDDPEFVWPYRRAMVQAKMFDRVNPILDEVIAKGSRGDAAKAQNLRGDIRTVQGLTDAAALDYLRTVILFEAESEAQPEALYKAAEALEKKNDPRSKMLYERLKKEYPSSGYAAKAASK